MTEWAIAVILGHARGRIWEPGETAADALMAATSRWRDRDTFSFGSRLELELDRSGRPRSRRGQRDPEPQGELW